ncbi:MAG: response regulator [Pseudomonadota bacterium]
MSPKILIVEDEPALAEVLKDYLEQMGMDALLLHDGANAVEIILETKPDLVILDVMLPGKDGLTICREVRAVSEVPIILETARVEEIDRLLGLELGADDYICKPWSPREVVARVKTILRRVDRSVSAQPDTSSNDGLTLDAENWTTRYNGDLVDLTRREFQLLSVMANRPGRVYSRSQLLDLAFPDDADVYDRTIDSHIKNIRQKLGRHTDGVEHIRSVYGVGYAFDR